MSTKRKLKEDELVIIAGTLTCGCRMENHTGMEQIGELSETGYSLDDLIRIREYFIEKGACEAQIELIWLNEYLPPDLHKDAEDAYILIIHNGVDILVPGLSYELIKEHQSLTVDKHYYDNRRSKVLNKRARWNLCFDDIGQEPDYENKKGTIISYSDVPFTNILRNEIIKIIGDFKMEANYYHNSSKGSGIGYHGDTERRRVFGIRLGAGIPLSFKWFIRNKQVGVTFSKTLKGSDIYVMSEKAVGMDWKQYSKYTLRHAAGSRHYTE